MLKGLRHPQFTPSTFLSRAAGPRLSQVSFSQYCSVPGRWSTALLRPGEGVGDAQLRKPSSSSPLSSPLSSSWSSSPPSAPSAELLSSSESVSSSHS